MVTYVPLLTMSPRPQLQSLRHSLATSRPTLLASVCSYIASIKCQRLVLCTNVHFKSKLNVIIPDFFPFMSLLVERWQTSGALVEG